MEGITITKKKEILREIKDIRATLKDGYIDKNANAPARLNVIANQLGIKPVIFGCSSCIFDHVKRIVHEIENYKLIGESIEAKKQREEEELKRLADEKKMGG